MSLLPKDPEDFQSHLKKEKKAAGHLTEVVQDPSATVVLLMPMVKSLNGFLKAHIQKERKAPDLFVSVTKDSMLTSRNAFQKRTIKALSKKNLGHSVQAQAQRNSPDLSIKKKQNHTAKAVLILAKNLKRAKVQTKNHLEEAVVHLKKVVKRLKSFREIR